MAKVMLVEDDNNLREIYEARLAAEGYQIVSAHDGEEALALAVKELPDLIISDIMMPKISGFDMLDILRSTPETKDTKVIMMTALSQMEDQQRAGKLGADRYLVKSQVTLEDVVRVAKEVLGQSEGAVPAAVVGATSDASATVAADPAASATDDVTAAPEPTALADDAVQATSDDTNAVVAEPPAEPTTVPAEPAQAAQTPPEEAASPAPAAEPEPAASEPDRGSTEDATPQEVAPEQPAGSIEDQIKDFITTTEQVKNNASQPDSATAAAPAQATGTQIPVTDGSAAQAAPPAEAADTAPAQPQLATPSGQKKVIEPLNDLNAPGPDLDALLAQEEAKQAPADANMPSVNTVISPDGTLSYATAPETNDTSAAPEASEPNQPLAQPPADDAASSSQPHEPGQKIDPDSVAL